VERIYQRLPLLLLLACLAPFGLAQDQVYVEETDPRVRAKLQTWQDARLGLLLHWGPYSQWGIVESWSICAEDEPWCARNTESYTDYVRAYEKLQTTFDPVEFDPSRWARAAKRAGMRYVVFTTKHHDGFSMFDTRQTDYRITDPATPFSKRPLANITKELFDAFRAEGFLVGAYFSKPDWHSPFYWWPRFATPDRNVNYDVEKYPDRWKKFVEFTHAQIDELMTGYGRVDILWLDGGWVRPKSREEILRRITSPDYKFARVQSQDIDMPRLVKSAREKQPGLIVVDRDVPGPYQNYLTPRPASPRRRFPIRGRCRCPWPRAGRTCRATATSRPMPSCTCWPTSRPRAATCCSTSVPTPGAASMPTPTTAWKSSGNGWPSTARRSTARGRWRLIGKGRSGSRRARMERSTRSTWQTREKSASRHSSS
jgi:alpha-L-fucosidase